MLRPFNFHTLPWNKLWAGSLVRSWSNRVQNPGEGVWVEGEEDLGGGEREKAISDPRMTEFRRFKQLHTPPLSTNE